jgi:ribose transport system ATP-binding protein
VPRDALTVSAVEKAFGPNAVLRGVTITIEEGTVHALLGENGAGKSTLVRILVGALAKDAGTMTLGGAPYAPRSPRDARASGVVIVPQERTLCFDLTVAENVTLGIEPTAYGFVRAPRARAIAERALAAVCGDRIALDRSVRELSVADRQLVEIARALAQGGLDQCGELAARVLVLDEPTSSLGQGDALRLFERIRAMKETGLAVLLVTHFLADVREQADRYTVLRDGRVHGEGRPREVPPEKIVLEMLGRELKSALTEAAHESAASADTLLEVDAISAVTRPARATFALGRGEIFGIAGLVGSGRTELLRVIAGLDPARSGTVRVNVAGGLGLLSEDRGGEGLMLERSISENVALSSRGGFFVSPRAERAEALRWIDELQIRSRGPDQSVGDLSGGNQQKVQLARLLRENYDILLVDEPTRGVDVGSRAQILSVLRELAGRGKGIIVVSSQFDELLAVCDRVAVLRAGELGPARAATAWTESALLLEASS